MLVHLLNIHHAIYYFHLGYVENIKARYVDRNLGSPVAPWGFLDEDIGRDHTDQYSVFLKPVMTYNRSLAASSFDSITQYYPADDMQDLAKGYGEKYFYLRPVKLAGSRKITRIWLSQTKFGGDDCTENINPVPGKIHLYLCWKLEEKGTFI